MPIPAPPPELTAYLNSNFACPEFGLRCRAVISKVTGHRSRLVCCAVEAFPDRRDVPERAAGFEYENVTLFEEWLNAQSSAHFLKSLQVGILPWPNIDIEPLGVTHWDRERVSFRNRYVHRAGQVVIARARQAAIQNYQTPLLSPAAPYYPDFGEAVRDWLDFAEYHGQSDVINGSVVFLLPEARAFFTDAVSEDGLLRISVDGSNVGNTSLIVKGAYWDGRTIRQFSGKVVDGSVSLPVPDEVQRLDYFLLDEGGEVYDAQYERNGVATGHIRRRLAALNTGAAERVIDVCRAGEGVRAEFKPFAPFRRSNSEKKDVASEENAKFREYVATVVAFANAQGGTLFIGIDDACQPCDITDKLAECYGCEVTEGVIARYIGDLNSEIKARVEGEVSLDISHARVSGALVIVVDVARNKSGLIGVRGDYAAYVRTGASNQRVPPSQIEGRISALRGSLDRYPRDYNPGVFDGMADERS